MGVKKIGVPTMQAMWEAWRERAIVPREVARERMRNGWDTERAFMTPLNATVGDPLPHILAHIQQHGPSSVTDLTEALACGSLSLIGRTLRGAVIAKKLHTTSQRRVKGTHKLYHLGREPRPDPTPGGPAWVHPIRARALGLPVATRRDEVALDYAHPARGV